MNFIAEDFHLHYIPSYTLYVQSDLYRDYLIVVNGENEILVYITYESDKPSAEASKILSLPFESVFVYLPQQRLILTPSEIFEPADIELYCDYFVDSRLDKIDYKEIDKLGITGVYQVDFITQNRWKNIFPEARIIPVFESIIRQLDTISHDVKDLLGVYIYGTRADICLFINGQIRIYNSFEIQTPDDLSYFVISILKNFSIEGLLERIVLIGEALDSEWGSRLKYYTSNLVPLKNKKEWGCSNSAILSEVNNRSALLNEEICG